MFVEYIYIYIYEQYNLETARRNTLKLKHSISIEKTKHLPKQNWYPWFHRLFYFQNGFLFYFIQEPVILIKRTELSSFLDQIVSHWRPFWILLHKSKQLIMLKIMRMPPLFAKFTKVTCCAGKSQVNLDGFFFFFWS